MPAIVATVMSVVVVPFCNEIQQNFNKITMLHDKVAIKFDKLLGDKLCCGQITIRQMEELTERMMVIK